MINELSPEVLMCNETSALSATVDRNIHAKISIGNIFTRGKVETPYKY